MGERTTLEGTKGPIRLGRTAEGIALVWAEDVDDVLHGLGYCHGRDRGLQMQLLRILGRGQSCERLRDNAAMLEIDRFFRRLNFCGDAAQEEAELSPRTRTSCAAYCRGVSQAFRELPRPWELRMVDGARDDEPWSFADIYLTAKVIGYVSLAISQAEVERWIIECVQNGIGRAHLEELFPGQLGGLDEA